jgi:hypothetical protein
MSSIFGQKVVDTPIESQLAAFDFIEAISGTHIFVPFGRVLEAWNACPLVREFSSPKFVAPRQLPAFAFSRCVLPAFGLHVESAQAKYK